MKQIIQEEIIRTREIMGLNPKSIITEGKDDKVNSPRGYDEEFEYEDTPKHEDSFLEKLKAKLKGVSEEQMEYNRKHSLPLDWRGSKEGYHEHITNKQFYSGSN